MPGKKPPPPEKSRFSKRFDSAMVETLLTEAMVKADGWSLAEFVNGPPWLKELYTRHAIAAHARLQTIEETENTLKPSEHE